MQLPGAAASMSRKTDRLRSSFSGTASMTRSATATASASAEQVATRPRAVSISARASPTASMLAATRSGRLSLRACGAGS